MGTIQMAPLFPSTFSVLFIKLIFAFKYFQYSFSCGPPFGPFWSVKYLNFGQKLPIRATHQTILESRHPEVTKNPYYALSPEWSQKKVSAHGLILVKRENLIKATQLYKYVVSLIFKDKMQVPIILLLF